MIDLSGMRGVFVDYLKSQIGDDPELLQKVIPDYPPFVKRMLQDNGSWLATLKRDNVELVTDEIQEITAKEIPIFYLVAPNAYTIYRTEIGNAWPNLQRPRMTHNIEELYLKIPRKPSQP